ncbi:MAG: PAS domain S-box protein [Thermodesulfobacteriota bacterium]
MKEDTASILLVEDDTEHILEIQDAFQSWHQPMALELARNLQEAFSSIRRRVPDLVITDFWLPDGKGVDLIPSSGNGKEFPVIVMTGDGDEEVAVKSLKAGALDYVVKTSRSMAIMPRIAERILREWRHILVRRRAEQALRESEERLRQLAENIKELFWLRNRDGMLYVSPAYEEIWGRSRQSLYEDPDSFLEAIHPEDRDRVRAAVNRAWSTGSGAFDEEYRIIRPDGAVRWIRARSYPVPEKAEEFRTVGTAEDITERRLAQEEALRLAAIVESSEDAIIGKSLDRTILTWNAGAEKMYGYTPEEAVGKDISIIIPPDRLEENHRVFESAARDERVNQFETVRVSKSGHPIPVSLTVSSIKDRNGRVVGVSSIARDHTLRNELEKQLRQAQKMEAMGTLAGGIAHDFNNILFPIIGYSEITLEDVPENSMARRNLNQILKAAYRARDLIQQILAFSRQTEQEVRPIRMQPILKEALKFLKSSFPANIRIQPRIDENSGPVLADPTQIYQIIINLSTNAYHAMQETGGTLEVILSSVDLEADAVGGRDIGPGRYNCLTVRDNGIGISSFDLDRIFEPYFTTKEKGKGTGLGLSMVHGIVKNRSGDIQVESEPGRGTEFRIYFPAIDTGADEIKSTPDVALPHGNERILLIDDEEAILNMGQQMLTRLGYTVITQNDSRTALSLFSERPYDFDLVITDLSMPGMTGIQLTRELLRCRPSIPVIMCTGFSDQITEERAGELGIKELILKPILKEDIARSIRRVLDRKG